MLYEVTHHKQPPPLLGWLEAGARGGNVERRGRGNTGHRARAHARHTGMPRVRARRGPSRCCTVYGDAPQAAPAVGWLEAGALCVSSTEYGCGVRMRRRAHDTHTQEAQRKKITAPCGGACGRRTSFPMPWRRVTWHLGRTHAEHCATTASTARGGRWTCKGSGATHSGSPEEDLLGDPRCSWAMNKRCYKPLEKKPDQVDENLTSRS